VTEEELRISGRHGDAMHWVRADEGAIQSLHQIDRGWRYHLELLDDEGFVELREERVFPERLMRLDAHNILQERGTVRMNLDEVRWLRSTLDEVIAELERRNE
jgi:hypothetical protein